MYKLWVVIHISCDFEIFYNFEDVIKHVNVSYFNYELFKSEYEDYKSFYFEGHDLIIYEFEFDNIDDIALMIKIGQDFEFNRSYKTTVYDFWENTMEYMSDKMISIGNSSDESINAVTTKEKDYSKITVGYYSNDDNSKYLNLFILVHKFNIFEN